MKKVFVILECEGDVRRTELTLPSGTAYVAMDSNGSIWCHTRKPHHKEGSGVWKTFGGLQSGKALHWKNMIVGTGGPKEAE